jgi:D-alanine-D-alanine ligase
MAGTRADDVTNDVVDDVVDDVAKARRWGERAVDVRALGRVAVLMGGRSAECEVSRMSGSGVLQALRERGVDAHAFDPAERELAGLQRDGYARAFIALHGRLGEDGAVQGVLEWLGIPYTGSGVMASALAMDKVMTKRVWSAEGLATPAWRVLGSGSQGREQLVAVLDELGLPLIVKPPHEGSSIGVSKVVGYSQMPDAVALAARHDADVLCEAFVEGQELTCAVIGQGQAAFALPVVRIEAPDGAYDYEHKYFSDATAYHCPAGLGAEVEAQVRALALAAYRALGCRGWGRADLMLRASDRKPFLLEMNTSPGMTGHSLVPMAARAAGIDYPTLCLQLLADATLDGARLDGAKLGGTALRRPAAAKGGQQPGLDTGAAA